MTAPQLTVVQTRVIPSGQLEVRAGKDGDGSFEGWANRFGAVDTYGTHWRPGSWRAGGLDTSPYALLWMHDPRVVLGYFTAEERDQGLWISGAFDATPDGQAGRARASSGSASELSVGFGQAITADDDPTAFIACELMEVSQITARHASSPGASITAARARQDEARARARKAQIARARLLLG
jgi:HK97 family phage prohead protease